MEVGTEVWVKCSTSVWAPGTVVGNVGTMLRVKTEKGTVTIGKDDYDASVLVRNSIKKPSALSSLVTLKYLHEPDLLHVLHERFRDDLIYTYIGSALLAMNPFKNLNMYSDAEIGRLYAFVEGPEEDISFLPPHVFSVAVKALFGVRNQQKNQSILVSGESGSGKTETSKILMRFLACCASSALGGSNELSQPPSEIGGRILQTNPILESFGNARTIRNDNSSRFGKYITLYFGPRNELVGSTMCSYLLESVRLVYQSPQECNFHIFYELLFGADSVLRGILGLDLSSSYQFVNLPASSGLSCGDWSSRFHDTCQALERNGVDAKERQGIFAILGGLLHLGNVDFEHKAQARSSRYSHEDQLGVSDHGGKHLKKCAGLFGIDVAGLTSVLLTREIQAGNDVLSVELSSSQAKDVCRSLAKLVYSRMFSWLVHRLSTATAVSESVRLDSMSISILDIFGFEDLDVNRFEQLCINYANERLQAQFNEFVFEKEQETYESEGIRWQSIPFPSNESCIRLFDDKKTGLFALLDEECKIPGGSNQALAAKYYKQYCEDSPFEHARRPPYQDERRDIKKVRTMTQPFSASKINRAKIQFVVNHFAGYVQYELKEFLEKNVDTLPARALTLFKNSSNAVLSQVVSSGMPIPASHGVMRAPSVSAQFRSQLDVMMLEISSTQAHYIRCIKSNDQKRPNAFDRKRVVEQLRSGGVLEAVRIARTGFQVRLPHNEFADMFLPFQSLLPSMGDLRSVDTRSQCCLLAAVLLVVLHRARYMDFVWSTQCSYSEYNRLLEKDGVQIGKTMIFCREDIYREFCRLRNDLRNTAVTTIAAWVRQLFQSFIFRRVRRGFIGLQAVVRGRRVRKNGILAVTKFRWNFAARRIVRWWRGLRALARLRSFFLRHFWRQFHCNLNGSEGIALPPLAEPAITSRLDMSAEVVRDDATTGLDKEMEREHDMIVQAPPQTIRADHESEVIVQLQQQNARLENEIVRLQDLFINATNSDRRGCREKNASGTDDESIRALREKLRDLNSKCQQLESFVEDATPRSSCQSLRCALESDNYGTVGEESGARQSNVELILRNIQQQMDLLRESVDFSCKRSTIGSRTRSSWSSSHPTIRSSISSMSYGGTYNEMMHGSHVMDMDSFERTQSLSLCATSHAPRSSPAVLQQALPQICRWARSAYCYDCGEPFTIFTWRHHCRMCGNSFCHEHSSRRVMVLGIGFDDEPVRVCDGCFKEVSGMPSEYDRDAISHSQAQYTSSGTGTNHLSDLAF